MAIEHSMHAVVVSWVVDAGDVEPGFVFEAVEGYFAEHHLWKLSAFPLHLRICSMRDIVRWSKGEGYKREGEVQGRKIPTL